MTITARLLAPLLLALGIGAATSVAAAPGDAVPHAAKRAFPSLQLPDAQSRGQRAIDLLGERLPEVAAFYGKSADEFKALLLNDQRLRLDRRGRAFYIDELDTPAPADVAPQNTTGLLDGTLAPLEQTFLLHSRAGAKRTIYLNFRGATLTGTAWNSSGSITALPFDLDGVPYSFSTTELQRIQYIWQRVAEDFAAFDVDVTTEPPPADRLQRSGSTDDVFGTTVLVTHRNGVYSCSCGGVAYLGVFDDTSEYYKPALVFYDALGSNEKNIAEAASHEAGHNMGLGHDGTATSGYYGGHGTGATSWAPIMGVGYSRTVVQWSKGEYPGANNVQDDYVVMQSNGLPLRADDHGGTPGTSTALQATISNGISSAAATGVVERPTDVDVFAFSAGAGSATLTLTPAVRSANLDALITLTDAAGTVIATANPTDALNATLAITLPAAGTYYLSVQGTGKAGTDGYPAYGSIGQYALAASYPAPGGNQPPTAVIAATPVSGTVPLTVQFSGAGSSDPEGGLLTHAWTFGDGTGATGATASHTYTAAGSYTAQLQVTDAGGLTAARSVTITVDPVAVPLTMRVADIAMSLRVAKSGQAQATADVRVVDANGLPVAGAAVNGRWDGVVVRSSVNATTDASGHARFTSPNSRASGVFQFTVNAITLGGYTYTPQANTETSDSIQRP